MLPYSLHDKILNFITISSFPHLEKSHIYNNFINVCINVFMINLIKGHLCIYLLFFFLAKHAMVLTFLSTYGN